jgi:hypothetical protein
MKNSHSEVSHYFNKFIEAFYKVEPTAFDLENFEISKSIYKHIFKMKSSLWKFGEEFNRKKRASISEIFQDLIAMYLKLELDENFEIILEEKKEKLQPDILIKYKGKNIFILEIKTTIGWNRNSLNGEIQKRIENLSRVFNIPKDNVVYIFQSPWNVNREFTSRYWDIENSKPCELPKEFPYNKIRPLLTGDDPFYWKQHDDKKYHEYSENEIEQFSHLNIVIPLELTINEIKAAANTG